jgi:Ca-activated chloride channel family protein
MNRRIAGAVAVVCTLGLTAAVWAQQPPVFRGAEDVVRLFVTVSDRDGRLVTTLGKESFEVKDNGRVQPITVFDNTPQPIQLVVMLDVSGSMVGNRDLLRSASVALFERLEPEDRVRVGTFGADIEISPRFTNDVAELQAALPREIAFDAPTPLWRAVDEAIAAFDPADGARRVVLVLSDGRDSGSFGWGGKAVSQAGVIDTARDSDVMVYAIGMYSRGAAGPIGVGRNAMQSFLAADMPDPGLARVAEDTGGGYLELRASQNLAQAFEQVADELHRQYLIGFDLPARDGKVHEVDVRVTERGLRTRARKEYRAPAE